MNTLKSGSAAPAWPARTRMRTLHYEHAPQSAAAPYLEIVKNVASFAHAQVDFA